MQKNPLQVGSDFKAVGATHTHREGMGSFIVYVIEALEEKAVRDGLRERACACRCVCAHTHMDTRTHARTHMHARTHTHTCIHTRAHTHTLASVLLMVRG